MVQTWGEVVKARRQAMNISQSRCADEVGIPRQTQYAFEAWSPDEPPNSTTKRPTVKACGQLNI